jgi:uncharacterized protein
MVRDERLRQPLEGARSPPTKGAGVTGKGKLLNYAAVFAIAAAIVALFLTGQVPPRLLAWLGPPADLYQAHAFVTGQRDETRIPGFERALADVVKKVTGDSTVNPDEVAKAMGGPVQDYVARYSETDRMADIPIHDEQGTRDRPFDLLVEFKPAMINALAKRVGREPWTGYRPRIVVLLNVITDAANYTLTEDQDQGIDQRDSLRNAAWAAGLPLVLPTQAQLDSTPPEKLADATGADRALTGTITWTSGMKGWKADWKLMADDGVKEWQIKDVNFDEAFRNAMQGVAQILSGRGATKEGMS